ncbi:MAG: pilus assembly protein [Desulfobaccales bacterium]|nr:pilus assembly protein [Desulfobaccales bacterium]
MSGSRRRSLIHGLRRQQGGVAVEFALLLPVFLLLVFGIVDFGHAWYLKQELTSASREGARYGTRYQTDTSGVHILPNTLSPSISSWVTSKYASLLPTDANLTVTPAGTGYTSGVAGDDLSVACTARKYWFVLGYLIPGFGSYKDISAATVMKVE